MFLVAVGAGATIDATGFSGDGKIFPMLFGGSIAVLAAWEAAKIAFWKVWKMRLGTRDETNESAKQMNPPEHSLGAALGMFLTMTACVYVLGLPSGGGLASAAYFKFFGRCGWRQAIVIGGLAGLCIWVVFGKVAGLPVYRGML